MPVAIAPVNRKRWAICFEFFFERRDQVSVLFVNRADATKHLVMMRDLQHALVRHISTSQHVLQKRNHVIHSLWTTEGNEEESIVVIVQFSAHRYRNRPRSLECGDLSPLSALKRRQVAALQKIHAFALSSCTASTNAITLSTGVSGSIPWPRLKICPGRPPA